MLALKAWYCDSTHRYTMTDAVQPLPVTSKLARKPAGNPKADLRQLLHAGARLAICVDTARFLCGEIVAVARPAQRALRRLLLVRRHRVRQRRARPSRPDRRRAHGLARGLPDLRRERQRHRQDLQSLVLPSAARSTSSTRRTRPRAGRSAPTAISSAASSKASPTRSSTARRCAAPTSRTASPRSAPWWRSPNRSRPASGSNSPRHGGGLMQPRHLRQDLPGHRSRRRAGCGAQARLCDGAVQPGLRRPAVDAGCAFRTDAVASHPRGRAVAGVSLAALSGTYNMIHPEHGGARRWASPARRASSRRPHALGIPLVTLCTGTRDPDDQWRYHPDNADAGGLARHGCRNGEGARRSPSSTASTSASSPSTANVVTSASDATRLIAEMGSPRLKIVLDPANLFEHADRRGGARPSSPPRSRRPPDTIAMAHAKDRDADGALRHRGTRHRRLSRTSSRGCTPRASTGRWSRTACRPKRAPAVAAFLQGPV